MRVGLVQFRASSSADDNVARLLGWIGRCADDGATLVVCPEAAMHGFGRPADSLADVAEPLDGRFVTALQAVAAGRGITVVAGMFERGESALPWNTVVAVGPSGLLGRYRKLHLFDAAGWRESDRLAGAAVDGEALLVFDCDGLRVGVLTCYDLRFPELARALVDNGATALAVPAAWVAGPLKEDQWRVLLRARAIENGTWVLAAGQPGPDYAGRTAVVDPAGVEVAACGSGEGSVVTDLEPGLVAAVRAGMPSLGHRRFRVVPS